MTIYPIVIIVHINSIDTIASINTPPLEIRVAACYLTALRKAKVFYFFQFLSTAAADALSS